jgi:hypothetical protein
MSCCDPLQQAIALRDSALNKLCSPIGNPFLRTLILRTYSYETDSYSYTEILPVPYVKENPRGQSADAGINNVRGTRVSYQCSVSRSYGRAVLTAQTTDFIIDGVLADLRAGDRFSGILCEFEAIDDKVTYWDLTLIEKITEQTFTLI